MDDRQLGPKARLALRIARAVGLFVAAIGVVVLFGWTADIEVLKSLLPGRASMKVNTALGFVLSGAALALAPGRSRRWFGVPAHLPLAVIVGAMGLLTLIEYATGANFGIDELLFADPAAMPLSLPGRMSLVTASNFVLFAVALALYRTRHRAFEIAFVAATTLGVISAICTLTGYGYGVSWLYAPIPYSSIALHTTLAFVLLFLGLSVARHDLGWVAVIFADTPSSGAVRVLLPTVILVPLVSGWALLNGDEAGIYDQATGEALFGIVNAVIIAGIILLLGYRASGLDEALLTRQHVLSKIVETALDAFILMDEEGHILEWSPQAERIFGWSAAEALRRRVVDTVMPPSAREPHENGLARFLATGEAKLLGRRVEVRALRRNGEEFPAELVITPIRVAGKFIFSGFVRDLSELRQTEEQLRRSQKMEAVGQLTGGVAHDFNNLLAVIIGNLDIALDAVAAGGRWPLENALQAAERGATLVRQLLAFSRRQPLASQKIACNELVAGMADVLRRTLGEHIEIELKPHGELWLATGDKSQVENGLLNLAINARDAMPEGGKLTIETTNNHLDEDYAARNVDVTPGDYVMLAVSDTGSGMPPEVLDRAMEPFFTTKEVGKGTGLGLSMIYGFAKQSHGHLKIYSEVGHGTTVKLYLPRARDGSTVAETTEATVVDRPRGGETILVVEDDQQVRTLVVSQLLDLGYQVVEAESGPQALAILYSDAVVDLLFTDVVMPGGMTGRRAYRGGEAAPSRTQDSVHIGIHAELDRSPGPARPGRQFPVETV